MTKESSPKREGLSPTEKVSIPAERGKFNNLILGNPNYFGTFPKFGGKAIKPLSGDTTYEELTCLGLNPTGSLGNGLLEGVVRIKQHFGYGTDACGAGTTEYVRFFVRDATGWHDLGLSSVQVYDLAGPLPLSYSVSVDFSEARKFCQTENIVQVRAILSWQWAPTPGDPNFIPVWGNVVSANVQVAPLLLFEVPIGELIVEKELSIKPDLLKQLDAKQPLPANPPKALSFGELKALYADKKVPGHRFGFSDATKLSKGPITTALPPIPAPPPGTAPGKAKVAVELSVSVGLVAGAELGAILAGIEATSGDTTFEELTCAGYNPHTRALEGIIQVKQSSGYSGGLCTPGSTEYVSFFAFFGGAWNALGTAQVQVHDLTAASPAHPISYAVFRISNLTSAPCQGLEGVPLRAILSWETPPTGPNFIPVWGNILNTHVQPQIVAGVGEEMRLMRIGRVTVANIDNVTGLAVVDPVFVPPFPPGLGYVAGDCPGLGSPWLGPPVQPNSPFGGETITEGDFIPKIDVFDHTTGMLSPGAKPIIYQAWVTPPVGTAFQLTDSFGIELYPPNAVGGVFYMQHVVPAPGPVPGGIPGTQYYIYWESDLQAVNPRTLAVFEAGGLAEGNYTIEIRGFKWDGVASYVSIPPQSKTIHVYNGYPHFELTAGGPPIQEFRPEVFITLTSPSGDCGDVQVGDIIKGSYDVTDEFFGIVSIALVPITVGGIPQPENPVVLSNANYGQSEVIYDGTNTGGTSGTFTLSTVGMTPCGYTILLGAWDRALVSSSCSGHYNEMGVGFCLRAKVTPK
ncbi:MAG: hypothetical protein KGL31_10790 [candidate division NC10 bacterium]|nr:hypothetical protein [candidate division NC10 bacterium]MDE2322381.1 hypothetical protein [candidate division NC10 bacterium]